LKKPDKKNWPKKQNRKGIMFLLELENSEVLKKFRVNLQDWKINTKICIIKEK